MCVATLNLYEFAFCFYDYFMALTRALFIFDFHPITRMANRGPKERVEEWKEEKTKCIHKIVVQKVSNKITNNNGRLSRMIHDKRKC